ncbi:MAG: glycoside hydrolase family 9 protein [Deltaproteobacteria bacterium]|nr:glycoside hydrolase family 9 protein [Deltaproteobacteria bacterium]
MLDYFYRLHRITKFNYLIKSWRQYFGLIALLSFLPTLSCSSSNTAYRSSTNTPLESILAINTISPYKDALKLAIQFYDANRCGNEVATNNTFSWRDNCHINDGHDVNVDLTGGFHDAGDHVKFGLPQGYTASILGWVYYENKQILLASKDDAQLLATLRRFTDYFLKSHPDKGIFYYQVGDGGADHAFWGTPEEQTEPRPTRRYADARNPAADVLGETAAALALGFLNFKDDNEYAQKCLLAAKELYHMGKTNPGLGDAQGFYQSSSFFDDLSWAAVWLYIATGEEKYLKDIDNFLKKSKNNAPFKTSTMSWDNVFLPVMLKMYDITDDTRYSNAVKDSIEYWIDSMKTTPGGLKYYLQWGVLRYAANEAMLALFYTRRFLSHTYYNFAQQQIDYILGNNPQNISYIIGFGDKYPKEPHHRAAISCQAANIHKNRDCTLYGALVGGPNDNDEYIDDMNMYQYSEVALDYNAGLIGALSVLSFDKQQWLK